MPDTYLPIALPDLTPTVTAYHEGSPRTVALGGGDYLVAWVSRLGDGSGKGLFAQRYDALGQKLGAEFALNTTTFADQQTLSLTQTGTGFVAVWESNLQDGSSWGIVMQRFDANGVALGAEVVVNSNTAGFQAAPNVLSLTDGTIVVTWLEYVSALDDDTIFVRRFDAVGAALGDAVAIGAPADLRFLQLSPYSSTEPTFAAADIIAFDNGGFGVLYQNFEYVSQLPGNVNRLYLQRYDAEGDAVGAPALITQVGNSSSLFRPVHEVVALQDGGALIVSVTLSGSSGRGLSMVRLSADGTTLSAPVTILSDQTVIDGVAGDFLPDYMSDTRGFAMSQLADGSVMLAYTARCTVDRYEEGTYVGTDYFYAVATQQFDLAGNALNAASLMTIEFTEAQGWPNWLSIVALETGGFGLAWDQFGVAGNDTRDVVSLTALALGEGTTGDDTLDGGAGFDWLDGLSGHDVIRGMGGRDLLEGNVGNDVLYGGNGADVVYGGADNDDLSGGIGDDKLDGGAGNDTLRMDGGDDEMRGGGDADTLLYTGSVALTVNLGTVGPQNTGLGADLISGIEDIVSGSGHDRLTGNGDGNRLTGAGGRDVLRGEGGNDTLFGGSGDDSLNGGLGDDLLEGGIGVDMAVYDAPVSVSLAILGAQDTGQGIDTLTGIEGIIAGAGNDTLTGNDGANTLIGGGGRDLLTGGGGRDRIEAGSGRDTIIGGSGADDLVGSADGVEDVFVFVTGDTGTGNGADGVTAFESGVDRVDLRGMDADPLTLPLDALLWSATGPAARSVWLVASGADLVLFGDTSGNLTADFAIRFNGQTTLVEGDFVL